MLLAARYVIWLSLAYYLQDRTIIDADPIKESTAFCPDKKIGRQMHAIRLELLSMGISKVPLNILSDDDLMDLLVGLKALSKQEQAHHYAVTC